MARTLAAGLAVFLAVTSGYGGGGYYEFRSQYSQRLYQQVQDASYSYGSPAIGTYAASLDIVPEECRLYLKYVDSGKSNRALLSDAQKVKSRLDELLKAVDSTGIRIDLVDFDPAHYLTSVLKMQKEEIEIQYRITVGLSKDLWENTTKIASVLDVISALRASSNLERKLTQGVVTYAVRDIAPFMDKLLAEAQSQAVLYKKQTMQINKMDESAVFFRLQYGELHAPKQSLERVTVELPFTFTCEPVHGAGTADK